MTAMNASPAPATPTRLRLTRRGRVVFATMAVLPILAGGLVWGAGVAQATVDEADVAFAYVTVDSGETLWQIAEREAPRRDPRDVVDEIVSLNQLPTALLQPGQRLALPVDIAR